MRNLPLPYRIVLPKLRSDPRGGRNPKRAIHKDGLGQTNPKKICTIGSWKFGNLHDTENQQERNKTFFSNIVARHSVTDFEYIVK